MKSQKRVRNENNAGKQPEIRVVLDINILVSALLSRGGAPARVLDHVLHGDVLVCHDGRILAEYREVLCRPKFKFDPRLIEQLLDFLQHAGWSVIAKPTSEAFADEDDRVFYEVAAQVDGHFVTGNGRHFPQCSIVVTATEFLEIVAKSMK